MKLAIPTAVLTMALGLTACSSNSSGSGPEESTPREGISTPADNRPTPTKSEIVVGTLAAASGFGGGSISGNLDVADAWAKWVNDNGGINGHPVRVVTLDTQANPTRALSLATQMIQKQKIVASIASFDGPTEPIWVKAFADAKIPMIGSFINDEFPDGSPYWYPLTTGGNVGKSLGIYVQGKLGATKVGALVCQESSSCAEAGEAYAAEADRLGLSWAGTIQIAASAPNYYAACVSMKEKNPDVLVLGLSAEVGRRVAEDCAKQGFHPAIGLYSNTVHGPDLRPVAATGVKYQGYLIGFPWWTDNPAAQDYKDVMAQYGKDHKYVEQPLQSAAWTAFELFRKQMTEVEADTVTSQDVVTAMQKVKDEDLGGLLPEKVTFSATHPGKLLRCGWTFQLESATWSGGDRICLDEAGS